MAYLPSLRLCFYYRTEDEAKERSKGLFNAIHEYGALHKGSITALEHSLNELETLLIESSDFRERWVDGCRLLKNLKFIDCDIINMNPKSYLCQPRHLSFIRKLLSHKMIDFAEIFSLSSTKSIKNIVNYFKNDSLYIGYKLPLTLRLAQISYFTSKKKYKRYSENLKDLLNAHWINIQAEEEVLKVRISEKNKFLKKNKTPLMIDLLKIK